MPSQLLHTFLHFRSAKKPKTIKTFQSECLFSWQKTWKVKVVLKSGSVFHWLAGSHLQAGEAEVSNGPCFSSPTTFWQRYCATGSLSHAVRKWQGSHTQEHTVCKCDAKRNSTCVLLLRSLAARSVIGFLISSLPELLATLVSTL